MLIKSTRECMASFLLEMTGRALASTPSSRPMSRPDIADYLGLTIEIGSRTLALLASAATIEVPTSLPIVSRNWSALTRLNG